MAPAARPAAEQVRAFAARMRADWDARAEHNAAYFVDFCAWRDEATIDAAGRRDQAYITAGIADEELAGLEVLDIGCGIARMLRPLAARCARAVGIDVSPRMLARAARRLDHLHQAHLAAVAGTGELPFGRASFDAVFSCYVFEHVPSWVTWTYLREAGRVLRRRGRLRFQLTAPFGTPLRRFPGSGGAPVPVPAAEDLDALAAAMLAGVPAGAAPLTRGPTIEGDALPPAVVLDVLRHEGFVIEQVAPTGANNYSVFARRSD